MGEKQSVHGAPNRAYRQIKTVCIIFFYQYGVWMHDQWPSGYSSSSIVRMN